MSRQFFPSSDRPELTVDLTLRQNASIFATEQEVKRLEAILKADPDVDHFSSYVGRGAIRFILTLDVQLANPFFGQFVIVAKDLEARERLHDKLEKVLAEEFPGVVSRVSPLELGPPVGWPLQYRISGPDKDEVRRLALEFANVVGSDTRARHVHFDWMEPARQLRIKINQDQARQLGVSSTTIAGVLNAAISGTVVTQVRDDIYLINAVVRATNAERASFESLASLQVPTPSGRMVPLKQFATIAEEQEFPLVWRRDRVPTLTVRADVNRGVLPDIVVQALAPKVAEFSAKLPRPYKLETGGLFEESQISQGSVFAVIPLMIVLMLLATMVMLVSFRRMLMVVAILPLGLIGVVMSLLLFNRPLGFVAILGILALIGMIAKNTLILIVSIEEDRATGLRVHDAVRDLRHQQAAPDDADRGVHRAGPAADRTHGVLGSDGVCHHGRSAGGHGADAGVPARAVHGDAGQGRRRGAGAGGGLRERGLCDECRSCRRRARRRDRRFGARAAPGRCTASVRHHGPGAVSRARPRPQGGHLHRRMGAGAADAHAAGAGRAPGQQ